MCFWKKYYVEKLHRWTCPIPSVCFVLKFFRLTTLWCSCDGLSHSHSKKNPRAQPLETSTELYVEIPCFKRQQVFPQYNSTSGNLFITTTSVPTPGNPSLAKKIWRLAFMWFIDFGCWVSGAIQKNATRTISTQTLDHRHRNSTFALFLSFK